MLPTLGEFLKRRQMQVIPKPQRPELDIRSLILGIIFGFGTNLVTASPNSWPSYLRAVNKYAAAWLAMSISAVVIYEIWLRRRARNYINWQRTESPYPGLAAFDRSRASVFFGRGTECDELIRRLTRSGLDPALRFIPLVGPSGVGKSSLVNAGVLAKIPKHWAVIGPIRPGSNPFLALAAELLRNQQDPPTDGTVGDLARELLTEAQHLTTSTQVRRPDRLTTLIAAAHPRRPQILLVIDQLEDLATHTPGTEGELFLRLLEASIRSLPSLHILVSLRPDTFASLSRANESLFLHPFRVGPLSTDQLREVITKPARAAGLTFDSGVVEQMLSEATGGDALPLLSQLLLHLFEANRKNKVVTVPDYNRAGRVVGAITNHAEQVYSALTRIYSAEVVNESILRFVSWNGREPYRRTVSIDELSEEPMKLIKEELQKARMIVDRNDGSAYELAHDALLRQWERLRNLIHDSEALLRRLALLENRAQEWLLSTRSQDDLLRGRSLDDAVELYEHRLMPPMVASYINASQAMASRNLAQRADQVAERAQELYKQNRSLAISLANAAVVELSDTQKAILTLWGLTQPPEVKRLPIGHSANIECISWIPDGSGIYSFSSDGTICAWSTSGELRRFSSLPWKVSTQNIRDARLGANGRRATILTDEKKLLLWDIPNSKLLGKSGWEIDRFDLSSFDWSSEGDNFAGRLNHSTIMVWRTDKLVASDRSAHREVAAQATSKLLWSPSGTRFAHLSDGQLYIRDASNLDGDFVSLRISKEEHCLLSWSRNGDTIAIAEHFRRKRTRIKIFNATTGEVIASWSVGAIATISLSPGGQKIAIANEKQLLGLADEDEDAETGRNRTGHALEIYDLEGNLLNRKEIEFTAGELEWSPDESKIAFVQRVSSRNIFYWDLDSDLVSSIAAASINAVAWSADQANVAAIIGGRDRAIRLAYNPLSSTRTVRQMASLNSAEHPRKIIWSPDGLFLAVAGKHIEIRECNSDSIVANLDYGESFLADLQWSPDSQHIAASTHDFWRKEDSYITIWKIELTTVSALTRIRRNGTVSGPISWSHSGTHLAGQNGSGALTIWSTVNGAELLSSTSSLEKVAAIVWSPDDRFVATGGSDNTVRVWDPGYGTQLVDCLGHSADILALAWSPDGAWLASAAGDHSVRIWAPSTGTALATLDLELASARGSGLSGLWLSWSSDSRRLVLSLGNTHQEWTLPSDTSDVVAKANALSISPLTPRERERFGLL
ncbi:NACHT and WD repeat domain-containing protein [Actinomadura luteofluorescens]|uniref:NACHT and WD repeat domain-containing protein n=1 Tax=Actinomadura luteofluorescens TaxID=46163 RepID=UPI003D8CFB4D